MSATPPPPASWAAYLAASEDLDPDDATDLDRRVLTEARRRVALARAADAAPRDCPRCDRTRTRADFGADVTRPDGLKAHCRECRRRRGPAPGHTIR